MLVNVLPAKDFFSRQRVQPWTGWDFIGALFVMPSHSFKKKLPGYATLLLRTTDVANGFPPSYL
jgi:hypothetical protein